MAVVGDKFPVIDTLVPVLETITPGDLMSKTTPVVLTFIFKTGHKRSMPVKDATQVMYVLITEL